MEPGVRPVVDPPRRAIPLWVIIAGSGVLGLALFLELNARRLDRSAPVARAPVGTLAATQSDVLPPLYLPPVVLTAEPARAVPPADPILPKAPVQQKMALPPLQPGPLPGIEPSQPPMVMQAPAPPAQRRAAGSGDQVLVFDSSVGDNPANGTGTGQGATGADSKAAASSGTALTARARPANILNRAGIVPQGTLIPAVLETALDSTRAGGARALVTRDVAGFDGSRVVIPRGSRLYGEYRADVAPGQSRALVIWTRLVRPDGVSIAIDSPAADPLGRNGIRGKVDSHFLERFGSALLQTSLDIGANVAAREISRGSVTVLALPGMISSGTLSGAGGALTNNGQFQRTLKVRQGVSVSVFVSRDLDFTAVDGQ